MLANVIISTHAVPVGTTPFMHVLQADVLVQAANDSITSAG